MFGSVTDNALFYIAGLVLAGLGMPDLNPAAIIFLGDFLGGPYYARPRIGIATPNENSAAVQRRNKKDEAHFYPLSSRRRRDAFAPSIMTAMLVPAYYLAPKPLTTTRIVFNAMSKSSQRDRFLM